VLLNTVARLLGHQLQPNVLPSTRATQCTELYKSHATVCVLTWVTDVIPIAFTSQNMLQYGVKLDETATYIETGFFKTMF
jgi:hypothetical protein